MATPGSASGGVRSVLFSYGEDARHSLDYTPRGNAAMYGEAPTSPGFYRGYPSPGYGRVPTPVTTVPGVGQYATGRGGRSPNADPYAQRRGYLHSSGGRPYADGAVGRESGGFGSTGAAASPPPPPFESLDDKDPDPLTLGPSYTPGTHPRYSQSGWGQAGMGAASPSQPGLRPDGSAMLASAPDAAASVAALLSLDDERDQPRGAPDAVEDRWVTVYGFNPEDAELVLREMRKCGDVCMVDTFSSGRTNYVHLMFANVYQARNALAKDGIHFTPHMIIGVKPLDPSLRETVRGRAPPPRGRRRPHQAARGHAPVPAGRVGRQLALPAEVHVVARAHARAGRIKRVVPLV
eukprot:jgi/Mesvir1/20524/Mv12402-RA.1